MPQYRQVCLRLISALLLTGTAIATSWGNCLDDALTREDHSPLGFTLENNRGYFSGICVLQNSDEIIEGTILNEFGITGLGFSYNKSKGSVKLQQVIPFLNKWYIKKIVRGDLEYLFGTILGNERKPEKSRTIEVSDSTVVLNNKKYGLTYTFTTLNDNETY